MKRNKNEYAHTAKFPWLKERVSMECFLAAPIIQDASTPKNKLHRPSSEGLFCFGIIRLKYLHICLMGDIMAPNRDL